MNFQTVLQRDIAETIGIITMVGNGCASDSDQLLQTVSARLSSITHRAASLSAVEKQVIAPLLQRLFSDWREAMSIEGPSSSTTKLRS